MVVAMERCDRRREPVPRGSWTVAKRTRIAAMDKDDGSIEQRCCTRGTRAKESVQGTRCTRCTSSLCKTNRDMAQEVNPRRIDNDVCNEIGSVVVGGPRMGAMVRKNNCPSFMLTIMQEQKMKDTRLRIIP